MSLYYRHLARVIIESVSPIAVGSGKEDVLTDRLVLTDVNGLPFIPGTALAGVFRHALTTKANESEMNALFGFANGEDNQGSRLLITDALLVGNRHKVVENLQHNLSADEFLAPFEQLPIRQHVRITHKGAAEKGGKFDEQVVFKGTRFCFEMELLSADETEPIWRDVLAQLKNPAFRIGGGSRRGFGEITVVACQITSLDLRTDLERYLAKSASLADEKGWWGEVAPFSDTHGVEPDGVTYELTLEPVDFFLFGSGRGTADADKGFVEEPFIAWNGDSPTFMENKVLIPAASVKGALAHRVAFHYNKLKEVYADKIDNSKECLTDLLLKGYWLDAECFASASLKDRYEMIHNGSPAVRKLFGFASKDNTGQPGSVFISDIFLIRPAQKKLLNHIAIDRFTGGVIEGALFSEEVAQTKETFTLRCYVKKQILTDGDTVRAFESALDDLCAGRLPLGGGTMRGHGCFSGSWNKVEYA